MVRVIDEVMPDHRNLSALIALPTSVAGFATPLAAEIPMPTSSVPVTLNALRTGNAGRRIR